MSSLLPWDDLVEADGYIETDFEAGGLSQSEAWWRDHQKWLQDCGYMLRPRYRPGWVHSWKDKPDVLWFTCEDGQRLRVRDIRIISLLGDKYLPTSPSRDLPTWMRHAHLMVFAYS
jgi:hypothetical protein